MFFGLKFNFADNIKYHTSLSNILIMKPNIDVCISLNSQFCKNLFSVNLKTLKETFRKFKSLSY